MTTTELFPHQGPSTVSCLSNNVGSIRDFLFPSTHSSSFEHFQIRTEDEQQSNEFSLSNNREKLGHRRVDETGNVTYKRVMVDDLMKSLQIGLNHVIGKHHQPQRPVLLQDFQQVEYQDFPPEGSKWTPSHTYAEFRLKTYAQIAFRFFRNAFGVDPSAFISSICAKDLRELPNPGASGSIFYITADDTYIIKTVSKKEARFLLSLLPGYYMNLTQNPFTLLPKFFGLFCYQSANRNIRFVIMNNLVPTNVQLHEKYDLKGSIYKRKASEEEHKRELPTLKDNDFKSLHPEGLILEPFFYDQLKQTIEDDVRVLSSFGIMDYSLLLAVHNISKEMKSTEKLSSSPSDERTPVTSNVQEDIIGTSTDSGIGMTNISNLPTYIQYIRVIEFIRAQQESSVIVREDSMSDHHYETASIQTMKPELSPIVPTNDEANNSNNVLFRMNSTNPMNPQATHQGYFNLNHGFIGGNVWYNRQSLSRLAMAGIPAVNMNGDLLLLYVGIIDILQNYRLRKKLEHALKSTLVTREEISVCNPSHYGDRFVRFLSNRVFRKGGSNGNFFRSDSQSNTDQITLHSSRLLNPSSSYRSQLSDDDDQSSITNHPTHETHLFKT